MLRYFIYKKLFFIVFIIVFTSGCGKKLIVSTYSDISIPLANIENVNTTIEGSSLFIDNIELFLPSEFNNHEILKNDPYSPYILHIIENHLQTSSRFFETQEEKTIQYVDYIYDSKQNKTIPIVKTREIIYFQKCLVTDYSLSASVTTRFRSETISATTQDEQCLKRRFNLFNNYILQSRDSSLFYNTLVKKLTSNIKNYLVPYKRSYSVAIDDNLDVQMSSIDEENYENIIDMLADGLFSNEFLIQLVKLNNKYPNSYSVNYNLGLLYEYVGQNKNALFYYKKCLDIQTTKDIINRIQTINKNITNKEKMQL
jgi:hypothetical protein